MSLPYLLKLREDLEKILSTEERLEDYTSLRQIATGCHPVSTFLGVFICLTTQPVINSIALLQPHWTCCHHLPKPFCYCTLDTM